MTDRPVLDYATKAAMAKAELQRRINLSQIDEGQVEIDRAFFTKHYLRLLEEAFRAKDLDNVRQTLIALERLHFGKDLDKSEATSRKAKSKPNASIT